MATSTEANQTAANQYIDIQEYVDRLPNSKLLAELGRSALTGSGAYYDGWWAQLRLESADGSLPVDAAVAAYYSVLHPVDTDQVSEELGPDQARRLTAGEKVVSLSWNRFDLQVSGVLATGAIGLLGHPNNPRNVDYADVRLGLQFTDRRDVQSVFPANALLIGDQAITDEYRALIADPRNRTIGRNDSVGSDDVSLLQATALLHKFGLIDRDNAPDLKSQSHRLMESALALVLPENVATKDDYYGSARVNPHVLELLPAMHVLAHDATELRIREFAAFKDFKPFKDLLVQALAEIRSPMAFDSLSPNEQELWKHKAAAEIYETRCIADQSAAAQTQIRGRGNVASMIAEHHAAMTGEQSQRDLGPSKKQFISPRRRLRGKPN